MLEVGQWATETILSPQMVISSGVSVVMCAAMSLSDIRPIRSKFIRGLIAWSLLWHIICPIGDFVSSAQEHLRNSNSPASDQRPDLHGRCCTDSTSPLVSCRWVWSLTPISSHRPLISIQLSSVTV